MRPGTEANTDGTEATGRPHGDRGDRPKTHLSRFVEEAVQGGEVIIARANKPLVKLVPVEEARPPRRLGTAAGKVRMAPDFDEYR